MLNLPKATEFNKRIPKQKFYDNLSISPSLKKAFVEQIRLIYWRNKISTGTLNLDEGKNVTEIEVFEIALRSSAFDEGILKQIDKAIPYHILFVLTYENKCQAWIGYKETYADKAAQVSRYFHTEWMPETDLPCRLEGLSLDSVYEGFVRQIAGDSLTTNDSSSLKEDLERQKKRETLQKQIAALQKKIAREKQFNRKIELNRQMKEIKQKVEALF